jgi:hypothetical protein
MIRDALLSGGRKAVLAGLSDRRTATLVLVVGGDVADPGVQANRVELVAHSSQLGLEHGGVVDAIQVRPFGLDVAEEALDPGLVRRGARPPEMLGDGANPHELPDVICGPLSETASRIGRLGSSTLRSTVPLARASIRSKIPSASRAWMKATWTCVEVSSAERTVSSHLRVTRSMIATAAWVGQDWKWVAS